MNINVAICDDDAMTLETIPGAIAGNLRYYGIDAEIHKYQSALALKANLVHDYNLFFLDIDMPEMDGIKLAGIISKEKPNATIIFISGREERVFDAFSVHPFGFVRKSKFIEDISKIIKQYADSLKHTIENPNIIHVEMKNTIQAVEINDIIYIESYRDVKSIHLSSQKEPLEVRLTMEYFEEKLLPYGFYRVHKGYIVNFAHITRIDSSDITVSSGDILPISRRKVQEIRQEYLKFERK